MAYSYTVEELLLDETFVDYCLNRDSIHAIKWEKAIAEHVVDIETMEEARTLLNFLSPELNAEEVSAEVQKLKQLIHQNHAHWQPAKPTRTKKWAPVAAILILTVCITLFLLMVKPSASPAQLLAQFVTKTGERKKINLPDGSVVILNSNSSISYNKDFNQDERNIQLSGKAFFIVAKNKEKPFSVHSGNFTTTAIGTSFYVDDIDSSNSYSVKLLEGKVKLKLNDLDKSTLLYSGEEAMWQTGTKNFTKFTYDTVSLVRWLEGKIAFRKTPVPDALSTLSRWYGVQIIDNRVHKTNFSITGTYENDMLEDILKVICFSLDCTYKVVHNKIYLQ